MNNKIQPLHLQRRAAVYMRQSTLKQVHEHRESTARQYALKQRAQDLGWDSENIDIIDDDLGQSGSSAQGRPGFQRLGEDVAQGRIGAIFALEVSRLARSCADWHKLLDICNLADVLIADEQAVYSPKDHNDRLLLGLKGTMSEAELYWIRLRLQGGKLNKARRGELYLQPASGYEWDPGTCRFRFDADEQVQAAIRLVFERFRLDGSASAVLRYLTKNGLKLPIRDSATQELKWKSPICSVITAILHNPTYTGAYTYGRTEVRAALINGVFHRQHVVQIPRSAWKICLFSHHPAYITWDEFMANKNKLHENRTHTKFPDQRGAAREGHALLQGLVICGKCGTRMSVRYRGRAHRVAYVCYGSGRRSGGLDCWGVSGQAIDQATTELFLETVNPPELELGLAVVHEAERQAVEIDGQWKLRIERAHYDAKLAERRYKSIDPDNRVVARTIEREWNDKLKHLEELENEHRQVRQREKLELSDDDRARILSLSNDLSQVWHANTTTNAERKNFIRMLVREVTLSPIDVPERVTRVELLWQTGVVNSFAVPRLSQAKARATSSEAVELIEKLLTAKKTTCEIVDELNRLGLRTGAKDCWTAESLGLVRRRLYKAARLPCLVNQPDRRVDGFYSTHGVASYFGVSTRVVHYWMRKAWLQRAPDSMGKLSWFNLDSETISQLHEAKKRGRTSKVLENSETISTRGAL